MWKHTGTQRPSFAHDPGPGQESVWDYPRPPALRPDPRTVVVRHGEIELARTRLAVRVLETASPPTFYLPPSDVSADELVACPGSSFCEWKGVARYWALADDPETPIGWSYPTPTDAFELLRDHLGFYPGRVACFVDDERVKPQPGGFYGGWVTDEIVGPFKGEPGTSSW